MNIWLKHYGWTSGKGRYWNPQNDFKNFRLNRIPLVPTTVPEGYSLKIIYEHKC